MKNMEKNESKVLNKNKQVLSNMKIHTTIKRKL
jgi:hypothetical protein